MVILPKATQSQRVPFMIPTALFVEMDKLMLRFTWKSKGPGRPNAILKKNNAGGLSTDYKTVTTRRRNQHKDRRLDQWKMTENPEINPTFMAS